MHRSERRDHDVVLVLDAVGPLLLQQPDNLKARAVELHVVADRIGRAEQVRRDRLANDRNPVVLRLVGIGEEGALGDDVILDLLVARRRPDRRGRRVRRAVVHRGDRPGNDRRDRDHVGVLCLVLECGDVGGGEIRRPRLGADGGAATAWIRRTRHLAD